MSSDQPAPMEEVEAYARASKDLYAKAREQEAGGHALYAKALRRAASGIARYAKPLQGKTYSTIPHMRGSLVLDGDEQAREKIEERLTQKPKENDHIVVEEKLDGSCTGVARIGDRILAIGRAGYAAEASPHLHIQEFATWVSEREDLFRKLLRDGERLVGEWLTEAMGIRYDLPHGPFVAFDIIQGNWHQIRRQELTERLCGLLPQPKVLGESPALMKPADAAQALGGNGFHGALEKPEGAVWRCECKVRNRVLTMAKFVRPDFPAGRYMLEEKRTRNTWAD